MSGRLLNVCHASAMSLWNRINILSLTFTMQQFDTKRVLQCPIKLGAELLKRHSAKANNGWLKYLNNKKVLMAWRRMGVAGREIKFLQQLMFYFAYELQRL